MKRHLSSKSTFFFGAVGTLALLSLLGIAALAFILIRQPGATSESAQAGTNDRVQVEPTDTVDLGTLRNNRGAGDLTLIEYTDLECPFCKEFHPVVEQVMKDYEDRVRYSVKHFPLNIHPKARTEAIAAECAAQQGKFFEYVSEIFAVTPSNNGLPDEALTQTADKLGLDRANFTTCLAAESPLEDIANDAMEAQATGATGAPHTIIVDKDGKIVGGIRGAVSEEQLRAELDRLLTQ